MTDAEAEPRQDATASKPAVSLSEQLAFERLLGDLSARFAELAQVAPTMASVLLE